MPAYGYSSDDLRRWDETGVDPHAEAAALARCGPALLADATELAAAHGRPAGVVAAWWWEYCGECRVYGQSADWREFKRWYAGRLGAPKEAS
jgi:hypothetical protein